MCLREKKANFLFTEVESQYKKPKINESRDSCIIILSVRSLEVDA